MFASFTLRPGIGLFIFLISVTAPIQCSTLHKYIFFVGALSA
jgi:hypothetical protein